MNDRYWYIILLLVGRKIKFLILFELTGIPGLFIRNYQCGQLLTWILNQEVVCSVLLKCYRRNTRVQENKQRKEMKQKMRHSPKNILWRPQGLFLYSFACIKYYTRHMTSCLAMGYCKVQDSKIECRIVCMCEAPKYNVVRFPVHNLPKLKIMCFLHGGPCS
jgi:hypothetical protein